jgi:hypothetical protein
LDGRRRPVVSADLIRVERTQPAAPAVPGDPLVSTNTNDLRTGRRVIIAVDQTLIAPACSRCDNSSTRSRLDGDP